MTDKPTDEALENLFVEETGFDIDDFPAAIFDFARAVLAKWGQPAIATRITVPTNTMEQEFQNYHRRGFEAGKKANQPVERELLTADEQDRLYWRLHSLSKSLEGRGRIDEYDTPDAYRTILDAMNALRDKKGGQQ